MMSEEKRSLRSFFSILSCGRFAENLNKFFMGYYYPVVVLTLVFLGHITALELFFGSLNVLLFSVAMTVCESIRPIIVFALSFVYQVPLSHAPGVPYFSKFYTSSYGLATVIIFIVMMFLAISYFVFKNKIFKEFSFKKTPVLISALIMCSAFVLNGAFSKVWHVYDLAYGIGQVLVYVVFFLLIYYGLKGEDCDEICNYFVYVSALLALMLVGQVLHLYLTVDGLFIDGAIVKEKILFGWGIWNTAGAELVVLIPICFLGAIRTSHPWFYFIAATLTFLSCVFTLSRNALLFGAIAYIAGVLICCFFAKNKKAFRIVTLAGVLIVFIVITVLWSKISLVLKDFLERGFSDNGRFKLWETGFKNFLSAPVFGVGFFGFVSDTFVSGHMVPKMAHNTVIELISACGISGLLAYSYYRFCTLKPFFRKINIEKIMIFSSVLLLLFMSLLDNHVFYFQPILHYTVSIVLGLMFDEKAKNKG